MRTLAIDYGEKRTGFAISDALNITAQGLETIINDGNDKIILKKIDELLNVYEIDTIVVGMPFNMDGTESKRVELTKKFMHKLRFKYNKLKIDYMDERLTTVTAHRTMNLLEVNKNKKRKIVDTISAIYILEMYMGRYKK